MDIQVKDIDGRNLDGSIDVVVMLPSNFDDLVEKHVYHSNTISFEKYARNKIEMRYFSEPQLLLEQRSGEWFAPLFLFTQTLISENPTAVSIVCGIIANYITEALKGAREPDVVLRVICQKTKSKTFVELSYKGDISGLSVLQEAIEKAIENE